MSQNEVKVETLTTSQGFTKHVWSAPQILLHLFKLQIERDGKNHYYDEVLTNNFVDVVIKL